MSKLLEEKLPVISMLAVDDTKEKSFGFQQNYDELTGLKPGDSITSMQGVYDEMTGEAFILPPTEEEYPSNFSPVLETRSGSKSNKKAPVHVIYINGVNTTNKQYQNSLPLIKKMLEKTDIKDDYTLHKNTYNKSGKFDWLQSMKQGLVPGNFNDVEGLKFDENVVKKIKNIDRREKKEGNCEDNPRAKFLIIAHSQGNFFAEEIYNKLPANIKN